MAHSVCLVVLKAENFTFLAEIVVMKTRMILSIVVLSMALSLITGCEPSSKPAVIVAPEAEEIAIQARPADAAVAEEVPAATRSLRKEKLALHFTAGAKSTYTILNLSGKDYEFDQPSIDKKKIKNTLGKTEMAVSQEVQSVTADGVALMKVTIEAIKFLSQSSEGEPFSYDSTVDSTGMVPLSKLVGLSYTFEITPAGEVTNIDAVAARQAVQGGRGDDVIVRRISDSEIRKRHQVLALPDSQENAFAIGQTWSEIEASPQGMLEAKSFEKVYTLTDVLTRDGKKIAVITMRAIPSAERADNLPEGANKIGFFSKMFEYSDDYKGKLVLNLETGAIEEYAESLFAQWIAAEPPDEQKSDKGPDVLTMGYKAEHSIKAK